MIERFFRPFLGGIYLDSELLTSSRMLNFVFRMFSLGNACLPAAGMEAIPRQLAGTLPPDSIRLRTRAARVGPGSVTLQTGQELRAKSVVVAVDGPTAADLLGGAVSPSGQGTTCLYLRHHVPPLPILFSS